MSNFRPADTLDRAAIFYIKYLVERHFWNKNHKEIEDNPFESSGGEIIAMGEDFNLQIKAYDWSNEKDGYLKFYFLGKLEMEFRWYKHCLRGLEVNYANYDPELSIGILEECLELYLVEIEEK